LELEFDELFELELDELFELEFDELFELEFDELFELELLATTICPSKPVVRPPCAVGAGVGAAACTECAPRAAARRAVVMMPSFFMSISSFMTEATAASGRGTKGRGALFPRPRE
jgi:hypothetical protein